MKPIPLNGFHIDGHMARNLAEICWGRGGTSSYRTNRKGAYYYSCSGHGGYVVDGKALKYGEQENIKKYTSELDFLKILVGTDDINMLWVLGYYSPNEMRTKTLKFPGKFKEVHWERYPMYYFEEDCDWSILEYFTNIRIPKAYSNYDPQHHMQMVEESFERWHKNKVKPNERSNR